MKGRKSILLFLCAIFLASCSRTMTNEEIIKQENICVSAGLKFARFEGINGLTVVIECRGFINDQL